MNINNIFIWEEGRRMNSRKEGKVTFPNVAINTKNILTKKIHNLLTFLWIIIFLNGLVFVIAYTAFFLFNTNGIGLNIYPGTLFYNFSISYIVLKPMFLFLTMIYLIFEFNDLLAKFIYTTLAIGYIGVLSVGYLIIFIVFTAQSNKYPTNPSNSLNYCCVQNPTNSHCQDPLSIFYTPIPNCFAAQTSKTYTNINPLFLTSFIFVGVLFLLDIILFFGLETYIDMSLRREINERRLSSEDQQNSIEITKYQINEKIMFPTFSEAMFNFLNESYESFGKKGMRLK